MLLHKYEPASTGQIIGNSSQAKEIEQWIKNWKRGQSLILHGPTGCGKTLAVKLVAKEMNYEIIDTDDVQGLVVASKQGSIFRKKLILVEDPDAIRPRSLLMRVVEGSVHPVIIAAQSPYDIGLPALVKSSRLVRFSKISEIMIENFLVSVCRKEGILCDRAAIKTISKSCRGDVRAALLDLELATHGILATRDYSYNIFELLKALFTGDRENAKSILSNYQNVDELFAWISENIQKEYRNLDDMAAAYDCLSKADIFRARIIRRQSWGMQKYFSDIFVYGLSKKKRLSIATYESPKRLKSNNDELLDKISQRIHISKKDAVQYMHIIGMFLDDKEFCSQLDLDANDAEVIRSMTV